LAFQPSQQLTRKRESKLVRAFVQENWQLGFCLGNVVKYVARAGHKDNALEDLLKAQWYLAHEIEKRRNEDRQTVQANADKLYEDIEPLCKQSENLKKGR
jgi:hypothetical protein